MVKFVFGAIVLLAFVAVGSGVALHPNDPVPSEPNRALYFDQLKDDDRVPPQIQADYTLRNQAIASRVLIAGGGVTLLASLCVFLNQGLRANRQARDLKPAGLRDL